MAVLAGLLLALTYALVVRFLLRRGVEPLLAYLTAMAAALLGASHWVARPHLVTLLLVVVLLELVERVDRRSLWWYLPFFSLWTNLHGGFTYGLMLIGLYLVGDGVEWLVGRPPAGVAERAPGTTAWRSLPGHRRRRAQRQRLAPVRPPDLVLRPAAPVREDPGVPLARFPRPERQALPLARCWRSSPGLAFSRRRPSGPHLVVLLANIAFALHSQRNVELFAVTALPLMAWHLDPEWRSLPGPAADPPRLRAGVRGAATAACRAAVRGRDDRARADARHHGRHRDRGRPVRPQGLSHRRRRGGPGGAPHGPDLQRVHLGRVPALRLAGAEGVHRRRHRPLRRGAGGGAPAPRDPRARLARRPPPLGHLARPPRHRRPTGPRAGARAGLDACAGATRPRCCSSAVRPAPPAPVADLGACYARKQAADTKAEAA